MSTFIIAELSANHNGSLEIAVETIREAARCGVDAVKLQTYTADTLTINHDGPGFVIDGGLWDGRKLHELYQEAFTPWEWHERLFQVARECGLICFSSPFDASAVDLLEGLGNPIYKIASFEITDIPLIEYAASKRKPMVISTGIATGEEIVDALDACRRMGNDQVTLLKCTSAYPAPIEDANLKTMVDMRTRYGVETGLSDHTTGHSVAVAAVALGATMVEKHFILDRSMGGVDSAFSMEPAEFKLMVEEIRKTEAALGVVDYDLTEKKKGARQFARSLYVVKDIAAGEVFTSEHVRSIRPGYGLAPKHLNEVLGKTAHRSIQRGSPLERRDFE
jgi:pseudaminic acid synthase